MGEDLFLALKREKEIEGDEQKKSADSGIMEMLILSKIKGDIRKDMYRTISSSRDGLVWKMHPKNKDIRLPFFPAPVYGDKKTSSDPE